jgi:hypothetical protein
MVLIWHLHNVDFYSYTNPHHGTCQTDLLGQHRAGASEARTWNDKILAHLSQFGGMGLANLLILLCSTPKGRHYRLRAGNGLLSLGEAVPATPI